MGIFNCTYGLTIEPVFGFTSVCTSGSPSCGDSPFGDSMVIGIGYFVVVVLIIPMVTQGGGGWVLSQSSSGLFQLGR